LHVNWNNQCKASANCSDIHIPHILITQNILLLFSFEIHSKTTSKPINNSSSLNKENHDRDIVWISDLNQHRFLRFYFSIFSLVLVSIEKIYQTLKTVFDHISKHLEVHQKHSAERRIFNSLLGVWKCGQTQSFMFDILHLTSFHNWN